MKNQSETQTESSSATAHSAEMNQASTKQAGQVYLGTNPKPRKTNPGWGVFAEFQEENDRTKYEPMDLQEEAAATMTAPMSPEGVLTAVDLMKLANSMNNRQLNKYIGETGEVDEMVIAASAETTRQIMTSTLEQQKNAIIAMINYNENEATRMEEDQANGKYKYNKPKPSYYKAQAKHLRGVLDIIDDCFFVNIAALLKTTTTALKQVRSLNFAKDELLNEEEWKNEHEQLLEEQQRAEMLEARIEDLEHEVEQLTSELAARELLEEAAENASPIQEPATPPVETIKIPTVKRNMNKKAPVEDLTSPSKNKKPVKRKLFQETRVAMDEPCSPTQEIDWGLVEQMEADYLEAKRKKAEKGNKETVKKENQD